MGVREIDKCCYIDSVRTAIGKLGGALVNEPADFIATAVLDEVVKRADISKEMVDEVIIGQAKQSSDASNLARIALLRAGFPVEMPGYTVHRQCGSGIQAIHSACLQIQCGLGKVMIAGGANP